MPDGKDPDDYIKLNGKEGLLKFLKDKQIIQSYIWNYHLSKVDQKNPFEVSKFEKETKILHQKRKDLSKTQIIEFSILFIILNYFEVASKKIEELSEIQFFSEKNENLKNTIIT